jgi:hypothetical protein
MVKRGEEGIQNYLRNNTSFCLAPRRSTQVHETPPFSIRLFLLINVRLHYSVKRQEDSKGKNIKPRMT